MPSLPGPWSEIIVLYAEFTAIFSILITVALTVIPYRHLRLKYSLQLEAVIEKGAKSKYQFMVELYAKEWRYKNIFLRSARKRMGY